HMEGRKNPSYRLCLSLVQNDLKTVQNFQRIIDQPSTLVEVRRTTGQNKQVYDLRYYGEHALGALKLMHDDLVRKKWESETAQRQQAAPSLPAGHRPLDAADDMRERRSWASLLKGDARRAVNAHLDKAEQLGATRRVAQAPRLEVFTGLMRDFPHFSEVTAHIQQSVALSRLGTSQHLRLTPILLAGDPGVGKTAYVQAVAALLDVPFS